MLVRIIAIAAVLLASVPASAQEVTYRGQIAALMKNQCGECHGAGSPSLEEFKLAEEKFKKDKTGPSMKSYAELIRETCTGTWARQTPSVPPT
jgi:mono/diheme cytochrome c family protein